MGVLRCWRKTPFIVAESKSIYNLGTIRSNRVPQNTNLETKKDFSKERGAFDQVSNENEKLILI